MLDILLLSRLCAPPEGKVHRAVQVKWNRGIGEFLSLSQLSFLFGGISSVQEKDIRVS